MPNRILKESICTSDSIDGLGWFEEVLFYRLIVNCDDYGRFDGRPSIIKNRLFPLKENLTAKAVAGAIDKLASAGLVTLYVFEGKPYLYLPTWYHHQNVRAKRSKYPAPVGECMDVQSDDSICKQMQADVPVIQSNTESESESESESECELLRRAARSSAPDVPAEPPFITLPLLDGTEYPVTQAEVNQMAGLYLAIDVPQAYRNMRAWLLNNPKNRKTKVGIKRFVNNWLSGDQNRARPDRSGGYSKPGKPPMGSGELGEAELEAIRQVMADGGGG